MAKKVFTNDSLQTFVDEIKGYTNNAVSVVDTKVANITNGNTVVGKATSATSAVYASTATKAGNASSADKATSATSATYATTATKAGTANSASTATVDSKGQNIADNYIKGFSISGRTVTITKGNGSTATYTTQDNNTTYSNYKAATSAAAGKAGLVPAPAAGAQGKFLRGDGTWQTPSSHKTVTVTLNTSSWSNKTITASVTGVTASNTVIVSPAPDSLKAYSEAGCYCSAQASGQLTFKVEETPTTNLTVNVVIMN